MRYPALIFVLLCTVLGGCLKLRRPWHGSEIIQVGSVNSDKVEKLYAKSLSMVDTGQLPQAEELLQETLMLNPNHGPARNTLGLLLYNQRKFYLASWEFERAITLMPERPEPKNNLGLVLESVGKVPEAIGYYHAAWNLEPNNPEFLGNLLRARVRSGEPIDAMRPDLEQLVLIDTRPNWIRWAKATMAFDRNPYPPDLEQIGETQVQPGGVREIIGDVLPEPVESIVPLRPAQSDSPKPAGQQ